MSGKKIAYDWSGTDFPYNWESRGLVGMLHKLSLNEWVIPAGTKCAEWSEAWLNEHGDENDRYYLLRRGEIGEYVTTEPITVTSANIAVHHIVGHSISAPEFLNLRILNDPVNDIIDDEEDIPVNRGWSCEKDVEFHIKTTLLNSTPEEITITNEYNTDGIIRRNGAPVGILEFKIGQNFAKERNVIKVVAQCMSYYYKLSATERMQISDDKPFYFILGDENEIVVLDVHKVSSYWAFDKRWEATSPSSAGNAEKLYEYAEAVYKLTNPVYYKFNNINQLELAFKVLFN